ncbi:MerR family transcriptional regulator [Actinocorallia lasiicapitis]
MWWWKIGRGSGVYLGVRIGEAARVSGVSARSLRYYEAEGLLVSGRSANGYRDYCQPTIDRVRLVRALLDAGLSVRLVREVLPYVTSEDGVCAEFLAQVQSYRDRLVERIAGLAEQRAALDAYLAAARPDRA